METKLKKILKKKKITQSMLYNRIANKFETPVGQYALSEIVNGKKINYHLITLVKICDVLNIKPHSVVESEVLVQQLVKLNPTVEKEIEDELAKPIKEKLEIDNKEDDFPFDESPNYEF